MLAPYVEEGIVELHDWKGVPGAADAGVPRLHRAPQARTRAGSGSSIPTSSSSLRPGARCPTSCATTSAGRGRGLPRLLRPSGHKQKPDGLVIESYRRRLTKHKGSGFVKSIIDPSRAVRAMNPHWFRFEDRMPTVDENGEPVNEQYAKAVTFEKLRINHYWTRSRRSGLRSRRACAPTPAPITARTGRPSTALARPRDRRAGRHHPAARAAAQGGARAAPPAQQGLALAQVSAAHALAAAPDGRQAGERRPRERLQRRHGRDLVRQPPDGPENSVVAVLLVPGPGVVQEHDARARAGAGGRSRVALRLLVGVIAVHEDDVRRRAVVVRKKSSEGMCQ